MLSDLGPPLVSLIYGNEWWLYWGMHQSRNRGNFTNPLHAWCPNMKCTSQVNSIFWNGGLTLSSMDMPDSSADYWFLHQVWILKCIHVHKFQAHAHLRLLELSVSDSFFIARYLTPAIWLCKYVSAQAYFYYSIDVAMLLILNKFHIVKYFLKFIKMEFLCCFHLLGQFLRYAIFSLVLIR